MKNWHLNIHCMWFALYLFENLKKKMTLLPCYVCNNLFKELCMHLLCVYARILLLVMKPIMAPLYVACLIIVTQNAYL